MPDNEVIILGSSAAFPFPRTVSNRFADYNDIQKYQSLFPLHDDPICRSARKGGKDKRTRACLLYKTGNKNILFDAGPDVLYQLKKVRAKPDAIFITHFHGDAMSGIQHFKGVPVFSEQTKKITPGRPVYILGLRVVPFRLKHSATVPCVGYLIEGRGKSVVYMSDFVSLQGAKKYLQKSDLAFVDGSSLKTTAVGHMAIDRQLPLYKKWRLKKVVFTHIGHNTLPHDELVNYVRRKYRQADVAFDGMRIKL